MNETSNNEPAVVNNNGPREDIKVTGTANDIGKTGAVVGGVTCPVDPADLSQCDSCQ